MLISKAGLVLITFSLLLTKQYVSGIAPLVLIRGAIEIVGAIQTVIGAYKGVGEGMGILQTDHDQLLARFDDISNQIAESNKLNSHLANWTVVSLIEYMKHDASLKEEKKQLALLADEIDSIVSKTRVNMVANKIGKLQIEHVNKINELLIKYAQKFIGPIENKDDLPADTSVLGLLATVYHRDNQKICNTAQSVQQYVISVANDVLLYQLKGYAAAHFSLLYCGGNSTEERNTFDTSFKRILHSIRRKLFHTVKTLDRNIWRCDPKVHEQGKTFDQLTGFMQGYIENEVHMNTDTCKGTCDRTDSNLEKECHDKFTQPTKCFGNNICRGSKHSCRLLVDDIVELCFASPDNVTRYTSLKTIDNTRWQSFLGKNADPVQHGEDDCKGVSKRVNVGSYFAFPCEWCYCMCDSKEGNHKFSSQPALSNIKKNMVVTGIRFKRVGDTFYLQIQQGQLECYGFINSTTLKWLTTKRKIDQPSFVMKVDHRTMDLNRIVVDDSTSVYYPKTVVTGVKFQQVNDHLQISIRINKFKYSTGKLSLHSEWKQPNLSSMSEIILNEPHVPTRAPSPSLPGEQVNRFIKFQSTDLKKDIGQHAVPFLDMQNVVSNPPAPLSGIGLFHKSVDGYGGFIAPEIITVNFAQAANRTFEATIEAALNKKNIENNKWGC